MIEDGLLSLHTSKSIDSDTLTILDIHSVVQSMDVSDSQCSCNKDPSVLGASTNDSPSIAQKINNMESFVLDILAFKLRLTIGDQQKKQNNRRQAFSRPNTENEENEEVKLKGTYRKMVSVSQVEHRGFECDECLQYPIVGPRFRCLECESFDLCQSCYKDSLHPHNNFEMLEKPKYLKAKEILRKESWRLSDLKNNRSVL